MCEIFSEIIFFDYQEEQKSHFRLNEDIFWSNCSDSLSKQPIFSANRVRLSSCCSNNGLEHVLPTAERLIGQQMLSIKELQDTVADTKSSTIATNHAHPGNLFEKHSSVRQYRSINTMITCHPKVLSPYSHTVHPHSPTPLHPHLIGLTVLQLPCSSRVVNADSKCFV